MNQETIRAYCMKLPHATENVQWGHDLCFKIGGKMFCVMPTEASPLMLSLKVSAENFHQLQETDGIVPAPYMARASWVAFKTLTLLPDAQLKELLSEAHALVFATLTKKLQAELAAPKTRKAAPVKRAAKKAAKKSPAKRAKR